MGSPLLAATRTMTDIANLLTPIYDLLQDEVVREKVEESARVFFSNSNLTINLIPALIIGALGLLFLLPLLGIPILDILGGMMIRCCGRTWRRLQRSFHRLRLRCPRRHQLLRPDHRRPPAASCHPPGE